MARSKRAQVLMEPVEYERLENIAHHKGCSVAELIREAVREKYGTGPTRQKGIVSRLSNHRIDLPGWNELKAEIEDRHARFSLSIRTCSYVRSGAITISNCRRRPSWL